MEQRIYGLMAEFESPTALVARGQRGARGRLPEDGRLLAHSRSRNCTEALGLPRHASCRSIVLGGGLTGALAGFGLQYWASTIAYPLNIGGRPLHSWPSFIVPTFETTILFAAARGGARHARC